MSVPTSTPNTPAKNSAVASRVSSRSGMRMPKRTVSASPSTNSVSVTSDFAPIMGAPRACRSSLRRLLGLAHHLVFDGDAAVLRLGGVHRGLLDGRQVAGERGHL